MRTPDLVLVEDDANDVAVTMRALRRHGLDERITVLRDGVEAISYLEDIADDGTDRRPRAILLDLNMPGVDGWEVLRAIRASESLREIPVVVVSSSGRDEDMRRSYRLGANSFVVKRFEGERPGEYLVDVARYWLELNSVPRFMGR